MKHSWEAAIRTENILKATVKDKGGKNSVKKEFAQQLKASDLETKNMGGAKTFPDSYTSML